MGDVQTDKRAEAAGDALTITAQHTRADHARVSGLIFARALGPWRLAVAAAPIASAAVALALGLAIGHGLAMGETGRLALACGLALLAAQGANLAVQRLTRDRHLAPNGVFLRPFVVEADAEGLTARSETAATRLVWEGVLDIVGTEDFILIYTDGANALAIPKTAFPDALRMDAYLERLLKLWRAAAGPGAGR